MHISEKNIKEMLETPLMSFTSDRTLNDNRANSLEKALALFSLVLSENESPAEDIR